jgi:ribose/xylose/arabinose/galactoside ABC-type transport system permease subunit
MELHLPSWRGAHARPDWVAAAVSGFAAGAVLMVLELFWAATTTEHGPWRIPQMVAAIVTGEPPMEGAAPAFSVLIVAVALLVHYALGIVFGLALGALISWFHSEASLGLMQTIGAVFGLVLYLFNFHVMSGVFPWFVELRSGATLVAHFVFGIVAAVLYWKLARRQGEDG